LKHPDNNKIFDDLRVFAQRVRLSFPGAETELVRFSSGAAMLDIHFHERLVVVAYFPSGKFGVDEVLDNEGIDSSYRFIADDFDVAVAQLYELLSGSYGESQGNTNR